MRARLRRRLVRSPGGGWAGAELNCAPRVRSDRRGRRVYRQPDRQGRWPRPGLQPVVFDNLVYGHEWAVKWGPLVRGDLADRALLVDVMKRHHVDAVIHFAAYAYVGESVTNPRKYFGNNVAGTLNLLDAMLDAGVRDIVFSSTCATYGEPQQVPIVGGPPAEPDQPVRRDQAGGREDPALVFAGVRPALRGAALLQRGRRRSRRRDRRGSRSGDAPHPAGDRRGAAASAARSTIFGTDYPTPDGTAIRDYIHVADLADAHLLRAGEAARTAAKAAAPEPRHRARPFGARGGRDGREGHRPRRCRSARSGAAPAIRPRWSPTRARRPRCWAGRPRYPELEDDRRARFPLAATRRARRDAGLGAALAPAARGVGGGGGAPPAPAVDGRDGAAARRRRAPRVRSRLLPVPGQRARRRRASTRATTARSCSTTTIPASARRRRARRPRRPRRTGSRRRPGARASSASRRATT